MGENQVMKQNILPTDKDRAKFKARCIELLKPLEEEFDISFSIGTITECYGSTPTARTRLTFSRTKPRPTDVERKDKQQLMWEDLRESRFAEYRKDIVIGRRLNESFSPHIFATYKGEMLFELPIRFNKGNYISITNDSVRRQCQNATGKSHLYEQIEVAFQMILARAADDEPYYNVWDSPGIF